MGVAQLTIYDYKRMVSESIMFVASTFIFITLLSLRASNRVVTQCLNNQEQYVTGNKTSVHHHSLYMYVHIISLLSLVLFVMYRLGSEGSLWSIQGQMVVKVVVDSPAATNQ